MDALWWRTAFCETYGQNVLSSFCDSRQHCGNGSLLLHGCALDPQLSHGLLLLGICLKSPLSKSPMKTHNYDKATFIHFILIVSDNELYGIPQAMLHGFAMHAEG